MKATPSRAAAWDLVCEWIEAAPLRRHVLAVATAMRAYAEKYGEDPELWEVTGLVHDLDYERYPSAEDGHPRYAIAELERLQYPSEIVRAVASHADYMGVERLSPLERTLYAVDELSGFVLACAFVRPTRLEGLSAKSVKKKLKQASFAAAVNREQLAAGAAELGVDFDDHVTFVIAALQIRAEELGANAQSAD